MQMVREIEYKWQIMHQLPIQVQLTDYSTQNRESGNE